MPNYQVTDISLLLETLSRKTGVLKLDKGGFEEISRQISSIGKPYGFDISERYLKETIYNGLVKAQNEGKTSLSLSQAHVDTIGIFLNFKSFNDFQRSAGDINKTFANTSPDQEKKEILIIRDPNDQNLLTEVQYLTDHLDFPVLWISPNEKEKITEKFHEASMVLGVLSNKTKLSTIESYLPVDADLTMPPFFIYNLTGDASIQKSFPLQWQEKPMLNKDSLPLAISLLQLNLFHEKTKETIQNQDIKSKGSSTIISGNARVEGKYISFRDMNLHNPK